MVLPSISARVVLCSITASALAPPPAVPPPASAPPSALTAIVSAAVTVTSPAGVPRCRPPPVQSTTVSPAASCVVVELEAGLRVRPYSPAMVVLSTMVTSTMPARPTPPAPAPLTSRLFRLSVVEAVSTRLPASCTSVPWATSPMNALVTSRTLSTPTAAAMPVPPPATAPTSPL